MECGISNSGDINEKVMKHVCESHNNNLSQKFEIYFDICKQSKNLMWKNHKQFIVFDKYYYSKGIIEHNI